jgi:hypothetical protein
MSLLPSRQYPHAGIREPACRHVPCARHSHARVMLAAYARPSLAHSSIPCLRLVERHILACTCPHRARIRIPFCAFIRRGERVTQICWVKQMTRICCFERMTRICWVEQMTRICRVERVTRIFRGEPMRRICRVERMSRICRVERVTRTCLVETIERVTRICRVELRALPSRHAAAVRALSLISFTRALAHIFHVLSPSSLPSALSLFHRSTRLLTALGSSSELLLFPLDCFDPSMLSDLVATP